MSLQLHWRRRQDLTADDLEAWSQLGRHAGASPNPFAMPEFVLPAQRWLLGDADLRIAWFAAPDRMQAPAAVAVFTAHPASAFVPLPHLRDLRTPFSFRSGWLVAPGRETDVAAALIEGAGNAALDVRNLPASDAFTVALQQAARSRGGGWHARHQFERPVWRIGADRQPLAMPKDLQRRQRRAEEHGGLHSRLHMAQADDDALIGKHLALEHAGWKGEAGSSLQSVPAHAAFFTDMMRRFAAVGAAVFMETSMGGRVVASSSNLLLGDTLNAFKIGWNPAYAQYSPGRLNEFALCNAALQQWPGLRCFDSQTQEGGYLAAFLPDRVTMISGTLAFTAAAHRRMTLARVWRPLAYRIGDPDA